ncbi:MAG TPA: sulfite exporter TauE/SafE family protein [Pseudomonadales bacterium]|nr:sulfite exporter TauE/SafE family protein [Pseudomonadales bacterium]
MDISVFQWLLICIVAVLTGILQGVSGMAGGALMVAVLSYVVGIKHAIVIMSCALIIGHGSRVVIYLRDIDVALMRRILMFGTPTLVLGAVVFGYMHSQWVALVFALFLIASFPIKYWAAARQMKTSPKVLSIASVVWGLLAGNVVGPGLFLAPFLLGTGINRLAFVGTMATVTLAMNAIKALVFGATGQMNVELVSVGIVIGLFMVPGNWLGKKLLEKMDDQGHRRMIDLLTLLLIFHFFWYATNAA